MERKRNSIVVRKDVVNKNLLRSIKRLVSQKFEEQSNVKELSSKQQKAEFYSLIEGFINQYFPRFDQVSTVGDNPKEEDSNLSQAGIKCFVGMLVLPKFFKAHFKNYHSDLNSCYLFLNLLRNYSHRKLLRQMANQNFVFIVASLKENGGLQEIIENYDTNKQNSQAYYEAADNIINGTMPAK